MLRLFPHQQLKKISFESKKKKKILEHFFIIDSLGHNFKIQSFCLYIFEMQHDQYWKQGEA